MPHFAPRKPTPRGPSASASGSGPTASRGGENGTAARHRFGLERLSLRKHEVDPIEIYRHIFGKEPAIDGHTGSLVHPGPGGGAADPATHRPGA